MDKRLSAIHLFSVLTRPVIVQPEDIARAIAEDPDDLRAGCCVPVAG